MNLQLKKPIIFIDIEATGLNLTKDRIIELSGIKIHPNGKQETKTWRFYPEVNLTPEMSKFLGITDEELKDKPTFKQVAKEIVSFFEGCDIGGYNPYKLDLPLLMEEMLRAGVEFDVTKRKIVDVQRIYHNMEKRNLAAAYQFYCNKELVNSHSAEGDAIATYEVFQAQLEKYPELGTDIDKVCSVSGNGFPRSVDLVGRIALNDKDEEIINFGKYKGQTVVDVLKRDPNYYNWMMNGDFTNYTKKKLTEIKLRMKLGK